MYFPRNYTFEKSCFFLFFNKMSSSFAFSAVASRQIACHSQPVLLHASLSTKFKTKMWFAWSRIKILYCELFNKLPKNHTYFSLSLTHIMVKEVLFLGQIFEMEISMDWHVMRTPESKNRIFSVWSLCVCMSVISITQKQIIVEASKLLLYICIM